MEKSYVEFIQEITKLKEQGEPQTSLQAFKRMVKLEKQNSLYKGEIKYICGYPLEKIERDLKIVEILKPRIKLKYSMIEKTPIAFVKASGFVVENSEEYKLLKEWLERNNND